MAGLRDWMQELIDELSAHDDLLVEETFIGKGLTDVEIDEVEASYDVRFARGIRACFREINGMVVEWQLKPEREPAFPPLHGDYEDPIRGAINVMSLIEVASGYASFTDSIWDELMDEEAKLELQSFRPVEQNVEEAFVGLICEDGEIRDQLFYLRQEAEGLLDAKSNLEDYFRALRQSRGFLWWQDAYVSRPAAFGELEMYRHIGRLFPNERFSQFK